MLRVEVTGGSRRSDRLSLHNLRMINRAGCRNWSWRLPAEVEHDARPETDPFVARTPQVRLAGGNLASKIVARPLIVGFDHSNTKALDNVYIDAATEDCPDAIACIEWSRLMVDP